MEIEGLFLKIGYKLAELAPVLREAESQFGASFAGIGDKLMDAGKGMTAALTVPIAAFSALSLKTFGDFEASMKRVEGLSGATGEALQKLTQEAIDLGIKTQFSAKDAADAMAAFAAKGFDANQIYASMPGILGLAAAGQLSMADASKIAAGILHGFNLEAQDMGRVTDIIAKAAASSGASVQDLGVSFRYVGPIAAQMGISIEQVAAALSVMADAGVRGQKGGTGLRAFFLDLNKTAKDGSLAIENLGYKITDVNGKLLPMSDIIRNLQPMLGNTKDLIAAFGVHMSEVVPLLRKGADGFDAVTASVKKAEQTGFGVELAKKFHEGWKGVFDDLMSSMETFGIQVGSIMAKPLEGLSKGLIEPLVNFGTELATLFGKLPQPIQTAAVAFLGLTAAAGPAVYALGKITTVLEALAAQNLVSGTLMILPDLFSKLGAAVTTVGSAALAATPYIAGLAAAWLTFQSLGDVISNLSQIYQKLVDIPAVVSGVKLGVESAYNALTQFGTGIGVFDLLAGKFPILREFADYMKREVSDGLQSFQDHWNKIKTIDIGGIFLDAINPLHAMASATAEVNKNLTDYVYMDRQVAKVAQSLDQQAQSMMRISTASLQAYANTKGLTDAAVTGSNAMAQAANTAADASRRQAEADRNRAENARAAALAQQQAIEAAQRAAEALQRQIDSAWNELSGVINKLPHSLSDMQTAIAKGFDPDQALGRMQQELAKLEGKLGKTIPDAIRNGMVFELKNAINELANLKSAADNLALEQAFNRANQSVLSFTTDLTGAGQAGINFLQGITDNSVPAFDGLDKVKTGAENIGPPLLLAGQNVNEFGTAVHGLPAKVGNVFATFTDEILGLSAHTVSLGKAFTDLGRGIAMAFVNDAVKKAIGGLMTDLGGVSGMLSRLSSQFSSLFGGGSSAVGAAGGGVGGAGGGLGGVGGAAGGGLGGVVGMITGIGTLISGIVGNFQNARMEKTMNAIEESTRYVKSYLRDNIIPDAQRYWPQLDNLAQLQRLESIERVLYEQLDALRGSGGGGGGIQELGTMLSDALSHIYQSLELFRVNTWNQLGNIFQGVWATYQAVAKPGWQVGSMPTSSGGPLGGGGGGQQTTQQRNTTIVVQQTVNDPYRMGQQVAAGYQSALGARA